MKDDKIKRKRDQFFSEAILFISLVKYELRIQQSEDKTLKIKRKRLKTLNFSCQVSARKIPNFGRNWKHLKDIYTKSGSHKLEEGLQQRLKE